MYLKKFILFFVFWWGGWDLELMAGDGSIIMKERPA
jgi:hypothetical protein